MAKHKDNSAQAWLKKKALYLDQGKCLAASNTEN
jgi:hypothetical protein